jgi:phosphate:Na+ symporter
MGASAAAALPLDWFTLFAGMGGGLALFLYGLDMLSKSLRAVAGDRMRAVLGLMTGNRWAGMATGAFVTGVIQSSSVTTVLVVSFISAGVMSLTQAIPVIYGANIGSTVTAQIIAFKVTALALPMFALGFAAAFLGRNDTLRNLGRLTMGLGLVFFGMSLMGDTMKPLRSYQPFIDFVAELRNPLLGVLVGAVFTAVIQSSAATMGIAIVLASHGMMPLEAGIALAFGANIGTCATALLACIGKPRPAVRAALVHVIFNVVGVALWIYFIPDLVWMVQHISPQHPELSGLARMSAEAPREIANAHTVFNVINTFVFLAFVSSMAALVTRLVPERPATVEPDAKPQFLADSVIGTPTLGLDCVQAELGHLGSLVDKMLAEIMPAVLGGSRADLERVAAMDGVVDSLHESMVDYLRRVGSGALTVSQTERFTSLLGMANALENIGDVIETDLVGLGIRRIEGEVRVSGPTKALIEELHSLARQAVENAVTAAVKGDAELAGKVVAMKGDISAMAHRAAEHGAHRLTASEPNRLRSVTRELEVIERLRRIYYFAKKICYAVQAQAEASRGSQPAQEPLIPPTSPAEGAATGGEKA